MAPLSELYTHYFDADSGALYTCPESHLLIYPSAEMAHRASQIAEKREAYGQSCTGRSIHSPTQKAVAPSILYDVDYWSNELKCKISYSNPEDIFLLLETQTINDKLYIKFLFPKSVGWIVYFDWLEIKKCHNKVKNSRTEF